MNIKKIDYWRGTLGIIIMPFTIGYVWHALPVWFACPFTFVGALAFIGFGSIVVENKDH